MAGSAATFVSNVAGTLITWTVRQSAGGAVLGGAVLGGAVLGGAVLGGAVLGGAVLGGAVLGGGALEVPGGVAEGGEPGRVLCV